MFPPAAAAEAAAGPSGGGKGGGSGGPCGGLENEGADGFSGGNEARCKAMVTVKLFATLRQVTGEKSYTTSARSVAEVIKELERRHGDKVSRYLKSCNVLVNGRNIGYLRGKRTKLKDGDEVSLFPPLAGG